MPPSKWEVERIRDTTRWPRRWLAITRTTDDEDQSYGFIDALDVAGRTEILVRGNRADATNAPMVNEPLDGESLPVIARFASVEALLGAGWRPDGA